MPAMRKYTIPALLAPIAIGIGLYVALFPLSFAFGKDIGGWSTTAANNDDAAPDGLPEGMAAGSVNNSVREVMAALKRWYDDIQPSIVSTGSGGSYVFAASQTISSYTTGQVFSYIASFPATGAVTLNVDSVGAKAIVKAGGSSALASGDIVTGQHVVVSYDATGDRFMLLSPPSTDASGLSSPVGISDGGTGQTTAASGYVALGGQIAYELAQLTTTDNTFIVANGSIFVMEDANTARTSLGLIIESDVQAHDGGLTVLATLATTDSNFIVGDGSTWVAESGATARSSLSAQQQDDQLDDIAALSETRGNIIVNTGSAWINVGVGSDDEVLYGDASVASGVRWAAAATGNADLTESFTSAQQTITAAGSLTLTHSLAATPSLFQTSLVNITSEHGCAINTQQYIGTGLNAGAATSRGTAVTADNTNVYIKYGSEAGTFAVISCDDGSREAITNGSWKYVIKAWN